MVAAMRRQSIAAIALVVLGASCGTGGSTSDTAAPDGESSSSTLVSTTTAADPRNNISNDHVICGSPDLTSPAVFEETTGTYLAYVLDFVNGRPQYDVVQWLSGQEAVDAHLEAHPGETGGPPGGFVIVNENSQRRTSPLSEDAPIALLDGSDSSDLARRSVNDFEDYILGRESKRPPLVWITLENGIMTSACEHFVPSS